MKKFHKSKSTIFGQFFILKIKILHFFSDFIALCAKDTRATRIYTPPTLRGKQRNCKRSQIQCVEIENDVFLKKILYFLNVTVYKMKNEGPNLFFWLCWDECYQPTRVHLKWSHSWRVWKRLLFLHELDPC